MRCCRLPAKGICSSRQLRKDMQGRGCLPMPMLGGWWLVYVSGAAVELNYFCASWNFNCPDGRTGGRAVGVGGQHKRREANDSEHKDNVDDAHVQPYAMLALALHWPETEMHAGILACLSPTPSPYHMPTARCGAQLGGIQMRRWIIEDINSHLHKNCPFFSLYSLHFSSYYYYYYYYALVLRWVLGQRPMLPVNLPPKAHLLLCLCQCLPPTLFSLSLSRALSIWACLIHNLGAQRCDPLPPLHSSAQPELFAQCPLATPTPKPNPWPIACMPTCDPQQRAELSWAELSRELLV